MTYIASDGNEKERELVQDIINGKISEERAVELINNLTNKAYSAGIIDTKDGFWMDN